MEKVSIVIPIYNVEKYINRCLDSLINQTYKNIEIICVNDGSKDNSLQILKEYQKKDNRIIIIDKMNAGVSSARNDAIRKSTGSYITFVDADDWLELDAIESLYNTMREQNVDVIRGNFFVNFNEEKNESTGELGELKNKKLLTNQSDFCEKVIDKLLDGRMQSFVWLLMIKKECVYKTSLFKENIHYMEDAIFYIEIMININSIYFLDKPLYHYFYNQSSCSKSKDFFIRNIFNVLEVDKYITEIIKNSKYNCNERLELRKAFNAKLIIGYIYVMYLQFNDKEILKQEIEKILENEEIYRLLASANLKLLPQKLKKYIEKILLKFMLKRDYENLFRFFHLRRKIERK